MKEVTSVLKFWPHIKQHRFFFPVSCAWRDGSVEGSCHVHDRANSNARITFSFVLPLHISTFKRHISLNYRSLWGIKWTYEVSTNRPPYRAAKSLPAALGTVLGKSILPLWIQRFRNEKICMLLHTPWWLQVPFSRLMHRQLLLANPFIYIWVKEWAEVKVKEEASSYLQGLLVCYAIKS